MIRTTTVAIASLVFTCHVGGDVRRSATTLDTHVLAKLRTGVTLEALRGSANVTDLLASVGATRVAPIFDEPLRHRAVAERLGMERWVRIDLAPGARADVAATGLAAAGALFERVELDSAVEHGGPDGPSLPDDPHFAKQYGLHNTGQAIQGTPGVVDADLDAPEAWAIAADVPRSPGSAIVVGVVDSGVNHHVDLEGLVLPGWNVITKTDETDDVCSHGTHVAGIIAAHRHNGLGIAGVADSVLILPVVTFPSTGPCLGSWEWIGSGLTWAVDHEARIVNMSIHGYDQSTFMDDAVAYAAGADVLVVAIAGNNNAVVAYPGAYEGAMAIAATDNKDKKASFSNPGPEVDCAAAGKSVYSCVGLDQYAHYNGTSMAAPHVAGVAALLRSAAPWVTAASIWSLIVETTDDVETPGFDVLTGWGRINASSAMFELQARLASGDLDANGAIDGADVGMLLAEWGTCPTNGACVADLDDDGVVDGGDLGLLLGAWSGGV